MKDTFFEYLDIIQVFFQNIIDKIMNYDYIDSITNFITTLQTDDFLKGALVYFFILWVAIIIWVTRDILSRSNSIILQLLSILIVVFLTPILGLPVYFMIRPSHKKYDDEDYEEVYEEVEIDDEEEDKTPQEEIKEKVEKEELVASFEKIMCYNCHYHIEEDFKFCPNCEIKLLDNCKKCSNQIKTNWKICPYCGDKIEKQELEKQEEEQEKKKKSFFASLFSTKNKEKNEDDRKNHPLSGTSLKKGRNIDEKEEKKLDEKEKKILEVEKIKKEIEKSEKKEPVKNVKIRKSRKQRRLEKRMKKS